MTMNAAVMNLFLLLLGMIPIGHYAFAPSYYLSSSSSIASSSSSSSSTRLYYNNNNNTDNSHDTVGSDGESYFDEEKEQLQAERDRLVSLFASSSSSSSPPSPTAPSSPSSSSGKDKKDKKKMYFASKKLEKSSSTQEGNKQTKKEATPDSSSSSSSSSNKKKTKEEVGSSSRPSSPLPKKLSSMARKSLEMEMKLLESLKDSDDAQGEIWNFWYNHRGYKKMTYLYGAGQMSQHPNQWSEAELILRELIQQESDEFSSSSSSSLKKSFKQQNKKNDCSSSSSEKTGQVVKNESISSKFQSKEKDDTKAKDNGKDCNSNDDDGGEAYYSGCYGWVEPVNRLATLLFYQGRLKEAKELCEFVLTYKPWHFGCQTGIVTVCQHLNDTEGIEYWSSKRMPPLVVKNNDATTNNNNNKPIIPPGFSSNVNSNNNKENTNNNPTPREVWVNNMLQEAQNMLDFNGYDEDDDCQNCEEDMEVLLKGKEEEDDDEDEKQNVWE